MPLVRFRNEVEFGQALSILVYDVKGTFFVKPDLEIVVGEKQLAALRKAGLAVANDDSPLRQNKELS